MDENTGFITTASNFKGKKGQRFTIQVSAHDNFGRVPTNEAFEEATVQVKWCNRSLIFTCNIAFVFFLSQKGLIRNITCS